MPTATDFKDYYATLGVPKTATPEEIKRAYRKLARKCHPDLNPGDKTAEAKFKDLNEANQVLSDPEKREKYDQFGQHWDRPGYGQAPPPGGAGAGTEDFGQYGDFDSFINDLLGRERRTSTNRNTGGGFDDFGGGYRQAPAPDREIAYTPLNMPQMLPKPRSRSYRFMSSWARSNPQARCYIRARLRELLRFSGCGKIWG